MLLSAAWFTHLELETLAKLLNSQNILEPTMEKQGKEIQKFI